jgi:hypothetical protein
VLMGGYPLFWLLRGCGNPRVCTEADNLFGCYGTLVLIYKGVCHRHARVLSLTLKHFKGSKILEYL